MIDDTAVAVGAAGSIARIDASVSSAALVAWAVRVQDAFRATGAERIAGIIFGTDAVDCSVLFSTLSICSARIGIARASWYFLTRFN